MRNLLASKKATTMPKVISKNKQIKNYLRKSKSDTFKQYKCDKIELKTPQKAKILQNYTKVLCNLLKFNHKMPILQF
ncbi:hypothetical protein CQA40_00960 [Helicobacter sp. MIT 01-3238]|nr:hypothetical protein CQA40_00960 [Helicobacter sp. MIT 01-3238]